MMTEKQILHTFSLHAPHARSVSVAGTFNEWVLTRTPMWKEKSGNWSAEVPLPPGRYEYRFVVGEEWVTDPRAKSSSPNPFGSTNSVVEIEGAQAVQAVGETFTMREPAATPQDVSGSRKARKVAKTLEEKRR